MRTVPILAFLAVLLLPAAGTAADMINLPGSFSSDPAMKIVEEPKTWTPDNMYEHVNGEAELLKRYGAVSLVYASYKNDQEAYLSVDVLDMGAPVNAFGLYSLYAGCDGEEYKTSGATVLAGDFTSYATWGRYFMRIDFETEGDSGDGRSLVDKFLSELSRSLPAPESLPGAVDRLKKLARKPCEVGYHPEHVDYDLEAGPGYTWVGPEGGTYFIRFLSSPDEAQVHAAVLRNRGASTVLVWGNAVTWPKVRTDETSGYLKGVLKKVVKW
jgi:hypothetical protein